MDRGWTVCRPPRLVRVSVGPPCRHVLLDFLLSFGNHMRYTCAPTASPRPTPSSARRIGLGRVGAMTFEEILDQAIAMVQRRGRVTYRTLKLQFALDDEQLATLKDELLYSQPHVVDDAGRGLLWTGARERPTDSPS